MYLEDKFIKRTFFCPLENTLQALQIPPPMTETERELFDAKKEVGELLNNAAYPPFSTTATYSGRLYSQF